VARAASALALAALAAAGLSGCGLGGGDSGIVGGGKVLGRTVTVYSLTRDENTSASARDLVDGEKLALAQAGGRAGSLSVNFSSLDTGDGSDESFAGAARRAINDPQIIAAVADATPVTVPLFNAAGILQVTPNGDTALARDANANPSGRRTLGAPGAAAVPGDFDARFKAAFGHAPQPSAQEGYRAMRAIIHAVAQGGSDRGKVVAAYLGA
jgi:hypothetical protein